MNGVVIKCMQWAQDRADAYRQASHNEAYKPKEVYKPKKRKRGLVTKGILLALQVAGVYSPTDPDEERELKKRKWNTRITLAVAVFLVGLYLFNLSPLSAHSSTTQQEDTTTAKLTQSYAAINEAVQPYNKMATLKSSSSAVLTAYPAARGSNALSSSIIDEQTGNLSYTRGVGKGDEALPGNANANNPNQCGSISLHNSLKGSSGGLDVPACPSYAYQGNDFMIGANGIFFTTPTKYTTDNTDVQAALGAMQIAAMACIVPLIALIGINLITGAITTRFANGIESLSRLIPVAVGIVCVPDLVSFVFNIEGTLVNGFRNYFSNLDVSSILLPSSAWLDTLIVFLAMGILLFIAQAFAPLFLLILGNGFTFGVIASVIAEAAIYTTLLILIPRLVLVTFAMALCAQILMRLVLINFYIILSPLAIMASGLPGRDGVGFTREWITGFFSLVFSQLAQVLVFFLGIIMMNAVKADGAGDLIVELTKYGTLLLVMRAPTLFKSNATGLVAQIGSSAAGAATGPYLAFM